MSSVEDIPEEDDFTPPDDDRIKIVKNTQVKSKYVSNGRQ